MARKAKPRRASRKPAGKHTAPPPDAAAVTEALLERYPEPKLALRFETPLELLVATMLSAQCTDARVNEVTASLFAKYRSAEDYARADPATFEQEIRPTGFYRNKAKTVLACARALVENFGGEVPSSLEALISLPGVGRKTANMVRGNAFGAQAIAVDTHVLRVANRLGLTSSKSAERVEDELCRQVPAERWTAFANAMILHGRETCTARRPRCPECVLYTLCRWPDKPAL